MKFISSLHFTVRAEAKWNKRKKRLHDRSSWFVKFDDRDNCNEEHIKAFHKLDYKNKISFTKQKHPFPGNFQLKNKEDLILFHTTYDLVDITEWLNTAVLNDPARTLCHIALGNKISKKVLKFLIKKRLTKTNEYQRYSV